MITNQPPAYLGATEPEIIIGVDLQYDFKKHYGDTYRCQSLEQFNSVVNSIPIKIRSKIGEAYVKLRASGWFPIGIDSSTNIKWHYQLDSRQPEIIKLGGIDINGIPLSGVDFDKAECNLARATVHKRIGKCDGMPKCEPWDFNQDGDSGR